MNDDNQTKDRERSADETNPPKAAEPRKPSPLHRRGVQIGIAVGAIVVLVAGGIWLADWLTHGRYVQTTNDAYLKSDDVVVSSKTSGTIEKVFVTDNERVSPGQPLVQIDDSSNRARVEQAQAQAEEAAADIKQFHAQIEEQEASIAQSAAQVQNSMAKWRYQRGEVERYQPLAMSGAEKPEKLAQLISDRDQALATLHQNEAAKVQAERKVATLRSQIDQSEAKVRQAEAQARQASVDVDSSFIKASVAGRVGDRAARVGQYVQSGTRLLTVVPVDSLYLIANYKETQLGLMRIGQPARIKVDALDGREIQGKVQSFSPGTGSEFAVIPATNATGNFTKIVQRVPVRLEIQVGPEARRVLVPGLSVEVSVDTVGSKDDLARQKREERRDPDAERTGSTSTSGAGG